MKRTVSALLIALVIVAFLPLNSSRADDKRSDDHKVLPAVFIFPSALERIDEEAFVGTAARVLIFDERFKQIGEKAFAETLLTDAFVPSATEHIADYAFGAAERLIVHGVPGSYAEDWARENDIPFRPDYDRRAIYYGSNSSETGRRPDSRENAETVDDETGYPRPFGRLDTYIQSERPQDRPELNPIDYRFP